METKPLSVESVSYGCLVNLKPSLESPNCSFRVSFDASDDTSFIEMDPNLSPSKRFLVHQDFDFHVPTLQPPETLVHADKLISNGILLPVESYDLTSDAALASAVSSAVQEDAHARLYRKSRSLSLRRYNRLPKRIIQKYMDLVRPLWCRMKGGRSDGSRVQGVETWECAGARFPRRSEAGCVDNRRRSCDSDSSIHEAVIHCKKTFGMS